MPRNLLDDEEIIIDPAEAAILEIDAESSEDIFVEYRETEVIPDDEVVDPTAAVDIDNISVDNIVDCPRCHKPLVYATAISGGPSESWKECPDCGTLINTFVPTEYQAEFLTREERYKMTAGGYGTGKTRTDVEDVIKHLIVVPGATVVVAARTYPAMDATFVKDFNAIMPDKLLKRKNEQKHEYLFTNNSLLLYRSFDDPKKLKSLNASKVVIIEGSDVEYEGFTMMQSRLRNKAALIPYYDAQGAPVVVWDDKKQAYRIKYKYDARSINIETNPASNWVKSRFLLDASTVHFYGEARNEGYRFKKDPDPNKYVQVVSTSANPHLPDGYEEEQTRDKSEAYIQQFFKGSFNFGANLIFPNFGLTIVEPKPLPRMFNEEGRRVLFFVIGWDYGISDKTHVMFGALSTETKKLYWYDEMRTNNADVRTLSRMYREQYRRNGTDMRGLLMLPRFDGRSYNKRESDLRTVGDTFRDEGLFFDPSFASHEARIIKTNSLINHNQMETYSTCEFFIEEMLNYKWKLDKAGLPTDKPEDGNDHGITAAEFIIVELPTNLTQLNLSAYIPPGVKHMHDKMIDALTQQRKVVFNPLEDNRDDRHIIGYGNNLIVNSTPRIVSYARSVYDDDHPEDAESQAPLGAYFEGS